MKEDFRTAFDAASKGSGRLDQRALGVALRYLGQNPSHGELQDLMGRHGAGGGLDINAFTAMLSNQAEAAESSSALIEAFQVFDKDGSGVLTAGELRHVLGNLGEKLTEEEVAGMTAEALDGQVTMNYQAFVTRVLGR